MDSHMMKNPNLETTHKHVPLSSQDLKIPMIKKNLVEGSSSLLSSCAGDEIKIAAASSNMQLEEEVASRSRKMVEENSSGRERLKRHRVEMSGRVWIPDIWGQEDLLKNWIDCTVFDSSLNKTSIMSAREALIQEAATSTLSC